MLPVVERFIRYAKIHTESDRETGLVPSTPGQLQFAYLLCEEMQKIGMQDVAVDDYGYVMGFVTANADRECPSDRFYRSHGYQSGHDGQTRETSDYRELQGK